MSKAKLDPQVARELMNYFVEIPDEQFEELIKAFRHMRAIVRGEG